SPRAPARPVIWLTMLPLKSSTTTSDASYNDTKTCAVAGSTTIAPIKPGSGVLFPVICAPACDGTSPQPATATANRIAGQQRRTVLFILTPPPSDTCTVRVSVGGDTSLTLLERSSLSAWTRNQGHSGWVASTTCTSACQIGAQLPGGTRSISGSSPS